MFHFWSGFRRVRILCRHDYPLNWKMICHLLGFVWLYGANDHFYDTSMIDAANQWAALVKGIFVVVFNYMKGYLKFKYMFLDLINHNTYWEQYKIRLISKPPRHVWVTADVHSLCQCQSDTFVSHLFTRRRFVMRSSHYIQMPKEPFDITGRLTKPSLEWVKRAPHVLSWRTRSPLLQAQNLRARAGNDWWRTRACLRRSRKC